MAAVGYGATVRSSPSAAVPASLVPHQRDELFSVLVADGHALMREALATRLTAMGAGAVHEAATVAEARGRAQAVGPCDLAILDLSLPDGSGLDLVAELRAAGWPRIVVLASSDDPQGVRLAFQAGAAAYLLKASNAGPMHDDGRRGFDSTRVGDPGGARIPGGGARVIGTDNTERELSAREVEVLQLVGDGQSNKEIGDALHLSALTVKSHLSRIGRKLSTGDRAQMVALAMRAGVIR